MNDLVLDDRVFIRIIAMRDSTGGLPLAAFRAADILDASGFGTVIIETVGTGQNQVDIMQAAKKIQRRTALPGTMARAAGRQWYCPSTALLVKG
jgi:putative protein kinase ArgK-like GTPase of G3E family